MAKILTRKHLREALKKEGLPSSLTSIIKYEKQGLIPSKTTDLGQRRDQTFSEADIAGVVQKVKESQK